jgi:VanZ family protein
MTDSTNMSSSRLRVAALVARCATILLLVAMFIATHIPTRTAPGFTLSDKVLHFLAFMMLTVLLLTSWELSAGFLQPKHYFAVWLFCTLYGAVDEITQIPVGRSCDGLDWLADIGGILTGLIIYRFLHLLWVRRLQSAGRDQ